MEKTEIHKLLEKHIKGNLNKDEVSRLIFLSHQLEPEELDVHLFEIWNTYNTTTRNKRAYNRIKDSLKKIIYPKKRISFYQHGWRVAAVILIPLLAFSVYFITREATIQQLAQNEHTILTSKGERTNLILSDGTKVTLAPNSKLTYPATFNKGSRDIMLLGEAYFEVTHNAKDPFIVHTKDVDVEVLGTKFNVFAYPDKAFFECSLIEGAVSVFRPTEKAHKILLSSNQKAKFDYNNQTFTKHNTDLFAEMAWMNNRLVFRSETISTILRELEQYYGVDISYSGNPSEERFTATYENDDIVQILKNLQLHYNFSYKKTGNSISLFFR